MQSVENVLVAVAGELLALTQQFQSDPSVGVSRVVLVGEVVLNWKVTTRSTARGECIGLDAYLLGRSWQRGRPYSRREMQPGSEGTQM